MGREASVTLADDSRNFAKLQVAVGLVCIAVLVLEYAGQLGLRPTAQPFGQLGEATSYHSLRYDLVGFWLPGGLLVVFGVGLRRVLGASWLSAGALVVLTVLGMCTFLLGLLPYSPDSLQTQLVRQAARALYLWSPSCAAFLAGGALLTQRRRGQAAFSVGCGVLMAVLAFWLTAFSATSVDAAPVEIATPWYVGTAAWLLQQSAVVGKQRWSRLVETPLIVIRLLAAVGIAALAAYVTDIGVPLLPLAIAQMDARHRLPLSTGAVSSGTFASIGRTESALPRGWSLSFTELRGLGFRPRSGPAWTPRPIDWDGSRCIRTAIATDGMPMAAVTTPAWTMSRLSWP